MEQYGAESGGCRCCLPWFELLQNASSSSATTILYAAFAIDTHATMAWVSSAVIAFKDNQPVVPAACHMHK